MEGDETKKLIQVRNTSPCDMKYHAVLQVDSSDQHLSIENCSMHRIASIRGKLHIDTGKGQEASTRIVMGVLCYPSALDIYSERGCSKAPAEPVGACKLTRTRQGVDPDQQHE